MASSTAYLSLGANLGDPAVAIRRAISLLAECEGVQLVSCSRLYRTPPWGDTDQNWFVNACIAIETGLTPHGLLQACQHIERRMGRERTRKWGPRLIDIDILAIDGVSLTDPDLVLPHPYAHERAFVLMPLNDIASDLMLHGRRVADWLETADRAGIEAFEE